MTDAVREYRRLQGMTWSHPSTGPMRVVPKAKADAAISELEARIDALEDQLIEAEGAHENARRWFEEQKKQFLRTAKAEWMLREAVHLYRKEVPVLTQGDVMVDLAVRYEEEVMP